MKNIYFIIYIFQQLGGKKKKMHEPETYRVELCRDPCGKKNCHDHVTMDGVRCKLRAVWKTEVGEEDRGEVKVTGPAVTHS